MIVQLPNGKTAEFPDGTPKEKVVEHIKNNNEKFGIPLAKPTTVTDVFKPRNLAEGFGFVSPEGNAPPAIPTGGTNFLSQPTTPVTPPTPTPTQPTPQDAYTPAPGDTITPMTGLDRFISAIKPGGLPLGQYLSESPQAAALNRGLVGMATNLSFVPETAAQVAVSAKDAVLPPTPSLSQLVTGETPRTPNPLEGLGASVREGLTTTKVGTEAVREKEFERIQREGMVKALKEGNVKDFGAILTSGVVEMAPQLATMIGAAYATGGGALAAGVVGGGMEGLGYYEQNQKEGMNPNENLARSAVFGAAVGAMEGIPFLNKIGEIPGIKGRFARAFLEGGTEGLENTIQAIVSEKKIPTTKQEISEFVNRVKAETVEGSGVVGPAALLGFLIPGGGNFPQPPIQPTPAPIPPQAPLSPTGAPVATQEQIDQLVSGLQSQLKPQPTSPVAPTTPAPELSTPPRTTITPAPPEPAPTIQESLKVEAEREVAGQAQEQETFDQFMDSYTKKFDKPVWQIPVEEFTQRAEKDKITDFDSANEYHRGKTIQAIKEGKQIPDDVLLFHDLYNNPSNPLKSAQLSPPPPDVSPTPDSATTTTSESSSAKESGGGNLTSPTAPLTTLNAPISESTLEQNEGISAEKQPWEMTREDLATQKDETGLTDIEDRFAFHVGAKQEGGLKAKDWGGENVVWLKKGNILHSMEGSVYAVDLSKIPPENLSKHKNGFTIHKGDVPENAIIPLGEYKDTGVVFDSHKAFIETALSQGKSVPAAVLADYPDLAAKYAPTPKESLSVQEPIPPAEQQQPAGASSPPLKSGGLPESKNKIFTDEMADKARERIRKKLGSQLSTGIDPELVQDGIVLAGYHIEKGARSFADFSKAMIDDMGQSVKPYLKSWYATAKSDPRLVDMEGLDADTTTDEVLDIVNEEPGTVPARVKKRIRKKKGVTPTEAAQELNDSIQAGNTEIDQKGKVRPRKKYGKEYEESKTKPEPDALPISNELRMAVLGNVMNSPERRKNKEAFDKAFNSGMHEGEKPFSLARDIMERHGTLQERALNIFEQMGLATRAAQNLKKARQLTVQIKSETDQRTKDDMIAEQFSLQKENEIINEALLLGGNTTAVVLQARNNQINLLDLSMEAILGQHRKIKGKEPTNTDIKAYEKLKQENEQLRARNAELESQAKFNDAEAAIENKKKTKKKYTPEDKKNAQERLKELLRAGCLDS